MAVRHCASLIALTIDENGIRAMRTAAPRSRCAVASAMEHGSTWSSHDRRGSSRATTQPTAGHVLEAIRTVKLLSDPAPKTVLGLSNVSQARSSAS
jgi:5-methyltetrahydrofolate corrinoid/iron sulfur protein methyltransferase